MCRPKKTDFAASSSSSIISSLMLLSRTGISLYWTCGQRWTWSANDTAESSGVLGKQTGPEATTVFLLPWWPYNWAQVTNYVQTIHHTHRRVYTCPRSRLIGMPQHPQSHTHPPPPPHTHTHTTSHPHSNTQILAPILPLLIHSPSRLPIIHTLGGMRNYVRMIILVYPTCVQT